MQIVSRVFLTLLISLTLASCSSTKTMQRIMSSWVGSDINQVIEVWGFPSEEKVINDRKIYVWDNNLEISATKWNCTRTLEVDQNNIVKRWEWQGNNCPYAEWGQYKSWSKK